MNFSIIEVDITPEGKLPLAGFAKRSSRSLQFGSNRLFIRIVRLESDSFQIFLIMIDSLYFSEQLAEFIQSKLSDLFGAVVCNMSAKSAILA